MRRVGVLARVAWLLLLVPAAASSVLATDVQPAVGHRAPDFTLHDLHAKPVHLSRVLREKAVLLNFWATWCPPCRQEMPTMERAYRDYKARGLEILAVSVDVGKEAVVAAKAREFMEDLKLTFPALLDPNWEVAGAYRLRGLPTTFLIDRMGVIRAAEIGFQDWASSESREKLEELLR